MFQQKVIHEVLGGGRGVKRSQAQNVHVVLVGKFLNYLIFFWEYEYATIWKCTIH